MLLPTSFARKFVSEQEIEIRAQALARKITFARILNARKWAGE